MSVTCQLGRTGGNSTGKYVVCFNFRIGTLDKYNICLFSSCLKRTLSYTKHFSKFSQMFYEQHHTHIGCCIVHLLKLTLKSKNINIFKSELNWNVKNQCAVMNSANTGKQAFLFFLNLGDDVCPVYLKHFDPLFEGSLLPAARLTGSKDAII